MRITSIVALALAALSIPPMFVSYHVVWLIISRVLHGIAASASMISSTFLVIVNVPSQDHGAAMGWVSLALTLGCLLGSSSGGPLYEYAGGGGIMLICEASIILSLYLAICCDTAPQPELTPIHNDINGGDLHGANRRVSLSEDKSTFSVLRSRLGNYWHVFSLLIRQRSVIQMLLSMTAVCVTMASLEAVRKSDPNIKIST